MKQAAIAVLAASVLSFSGAAQAQQASGGKSTFHKAVCFAKLGRNSQDRLPRLKQVGDQGEESALELSFYCILEVACHCHHRGCACAAGEDPSTSTPPTVYFGNGCFWGRQKDFVDVEKGLGRKGENVSATVGYAGGANAGQPLQPPLSEYALNVIANVAAQRPTRPAT